MKIKIWERSKKVILKEFFYFLKSENYSKDWPVYFDRARDVIYGLLIKKYTDFLIWELH